jgi:hypothetical protein
MRVCFSLLTVALFGAISLVRAQVPDFTPPTPLLGAIMRQDVAEVKRLLDSGADPNQGRFFGGTTPLLLAIAQHQHEVALQLLEKGADPKAVDAGGSTALMWASTTETGELSIVKELLRRGADPNLPNKSGETALMWALKRGYTPVVETLKQHGASDAAMVKTAVERAITLLQKSGPEFIKVSGCSSCHNQSLPQMVFQQARDRGYAVDSANSEYQVKAAMAMYKPLKDALLTGKMKVPDPPITISYGLIGLAAEGYRPDEYTDSLVKAITDEQMANGSFRVFASRPPMESSAIAGTALSIRALQLYGKDAGDRIRRATEWLVNATPRTSEERSMQLLGLAWAKANPDQIRTAGRALLAEQRVDGGWGQLTTLETDAYATGQAMYALAMAGMLRTSDAAYQRGAAYLLRTQRPDGSWLVKSRSVPFQPYKESGFPHGKDQWISAAGTSWAALALTVPAQPAGSQVSQTF